MRFFMCFPTRSLKKANSASSNVGCFARSFVVSCVGVVGAVCGVSVGGMAACGSLDHAEFAGEMLAAVRSGSPLGGGSCFRRLVACGRSARKYSSDASIWRLVLRFVVKP